MLCNLWRTLEKIEMPRKHDDLDRKIRLYGPFITFKKPFIITLGYHCNLMTMNKVNVIYWARNHFFGNLNHFCHVFYDSQTLSVEHGNEPYWIR